MLVLPRTGAVLIEPGPARMWNLRYGMGRSAMPGGPMMAGAMGGGWYHQWHGRFVGMSEQD